MFEQEQSTLLTRLLNRMTSSLETTSKGPVKIRFGNRVKDFCENIICLQWKETRRPFRCTFYGFVGFFDSGTGNEN